MCWKKEKKPRPERVTRPTYEAGLPARVQRAVGGVVAGLRVGGKVKGVNCKNTHSRADGWKRRK